ncbi:MAG: hypothetical protein JST68_27260 [Bacteroidetes bacterium]|nr:hypothetical protein [Bacteroidota bacterium]
MKKYKTPSLLLLAGALLFGYGKAFGGSLKSFSEIVGGLLIFYPLWRQFGPPPLVEFVDRQLRRIPGLDKHLPSASSVYGEAKGPFNTQSLRKKVLTYTKNKINKKEEQIRNPEIFLMDFMVVSLSTQTKKDLKIIIGERGSGKSFQLIKMAGEACDKLDDLLSDPEKLEKKAIPLYIELKDLNEGFDSSCIAEYVEKSNGQIDKKLLQNLIDTFFVVFYFDGLDEIKPQSWEKCLAAIREYNKMIEIYITCRTEIYKEIVNANLLPDASLIEEIPIEALTPDQILDIIDRSKYSTKEKKEIHQFLSSVNNVMTHLSKSIILNLFLISYASLTTAEKQQMKTADENKWLEILWRKCENKLFKKELQNEADIIETRTYMVWVAKIMGESSFFIESIQPNWLRCIDKEGNTPEYRTLQNLYYLVTRITTAMAIGVAIACIVSFPIAFIPNSILGGITLWTIAGIYKSKRFNFGRNLSKRKRAIFEVLFSMTLVALLIFVCGVFQGFSVPRIDMTTPTFSMSETWPGIVLGFVLSTMLSYRIILEKRTGQYILPVKLFRFNWKHALSYAVSWGIVSGVITGTVALTVKHRYGGNLFINNWLIPFLNDFSKTPIQNIDKAIFLYAFFVTLAIAGTLIYIFAGRYEDPAQEIVAIKEKETSRRLYGILQTLAQASKHAFRSTFVAVLIYFLILHFLHLTSWYHLITTGIGIYLLSFLWYGGMEALNHFILRLTLHQRGIAPRRFSDWVQKSLKVGLINHSSYQLSFYHASLASYFAQFPLHDNPAIKVKTKSRDVFYYSLAILGFVFLLSTPFIIRYGARAYWTSPYAGIKVAPEWTKKVNDSVYTIEKSGRLRLGTSGIIDVGTFVGVVCPEGTRDGFMGMHTKNAYNLPYIDTFRHAALLYRINTAHQGWSRYQYVKEDSLFTVHEKDSIEVIVNDREYQNNLFHYKLYLNFCDTCK